MVHLHKKIHHHFSHHKNQAATLIGGAICTLALVSVFFITRGVDPHTSELAFTEYSQSGAARGSIIPASCESSPWSANGDGNYSGCGTPVCGSTHYNCSAGSVGGTADYGAPDFQWQWWCTGPNPSTDVLCAEMKSPTCGSVTSGNPMLSIGQNTYDIYAYNVSNASTVLFPTWSDTGGQDDVVWIPGVNQGNDTWKATVNFLNQPTPGQFYSHVYMDTNGTNQTFCGAISFQRPNPGVGIDFAKQVITETSNITNPATGRPIRVIPTDTTESGDRHYRTIQDYLRLNNR